MNFFGISGMFQELLGCDILLTAIPEKKLYERAFEEITEVTSGDMFEEIQKKKEYFKF